jgi:hypothetical protein
MDLTGAKIFYRDMLKTIVGVLFILAARKTPPFKAGM